MHVCFESGGSSCHWETECDDRYVCEECGAKFELSEFDWCPECGSPLKEVEE